MLIESAGQMVNTCLRGVMSMFAIKGTTRDWHGVRGNLDGSILTRYRAKRRFDKPENYSVINWHA